MHEDRQQNAFAALDILARADSAAFAAGRSDSISADVARWQRAYDEAKRAHASGQGEKADVELAKRELGRASTERSDDAARPNAAIRAILLDLKVVTQDLASVTSRTDPAVVRTWQRRKENLDRKLAATGYTERNDAAGSPFKVTFLNTERPRREVSVTVSALDGEAAEKIVRQQQGVMWGDIVSVKPA